MSRKPNGYWTYERCKEICLKNLCRMESLKYKNISEFQKNCWSAYNYSKINNWLSKN